MFSFEIKNVKIGVSFSFFAIICLIFMWQTGSTTKLLIVLLSCVIHELGHIIMMCLCSVPPKRIVAYGGGIKIYPDKSKMLSECQDILILSAGCFVNLLVAGLSVWINRDFTYFSTANIFLGLFNLMPMKYFDGGRVLSLALTDSKAVKIIRIIFMIAFASLIVGMFINGLFSISLIITFLYISASEFLT